MRLKDGLSEEGYAADPARSAHHLRRVVARVDGGVVVLVVRVVDRGAATDRERAAVVDGDVAVDVDGGDAGAALGVAAAAGMDKGEVLVCHVVGSGEGARITAVERYPT